VHARRHRGTAALGPGLSGLFRWRLRPRNIAPQKTFATVTWLLGELLDLLCPTWWTNKVDSLVPNGTTRAVIRFRLLGDPCCVTTGLNPPWGHCSMGQPTNLPGMNCFRRSHRDITGMVTTVGERRCSDWFSPGSSSIGFEALDGMSDNNPRRKSVKFQLGGLPKRISDRKTIMSGPPLCLSSHGARPLDPPPSSGVKTRQGLGPRIAAGTLWFFY